MWGEDVTVPYESHASLSEVHSVSPDLRFARIIIATWAILSENTIENPYKSFELDFENEAHVRLPFLYLFVYASTFERTIVKFYTRSIHEANFSNHNGEQTHVLHKLTDLKIVSSNFEAYEKKRNRKVASIHAVHFKNLTRMTCEGFELYCH